MKAILWSLTFLDDVMMDELAIGLSAILSIGLFDITEILTYFEKAFLVYQIFPPNIQSVGFKR